MTRVHQALERARAIGAESEDAPKAFRANPDVLGIWDFADPDRGKERKGPSAPVIQSRPAEAPAIGPIKEARENTRTGPHPSIRRSWIKRVMSLTFLRRSRSGSAGYPSAAQQRVEVFSTFLPSTDGRRFDDLIRDLARAEKEKGQ